MNERVSILIRSSARPELADALQSLIDQTHRDLDVVVVNVTGRAHPPLPAQASALRLKLVEPGIPLLRPDAANVALDAATGDHALFLDDDDLLEPDHVAACVAAVRADASTLPFTGAQIYDENGMLQAVWPALPFGSFEIIERIRLQPNAALVPRTILDEGFRFDPDLPIFEDWDFWIRVSRRIRFRPLPVNTAICRLGLGTSGTGVGANFDLERTARESRPFHAKWETERVALAAEYTNVCTEAGTALAARELDRAEAACWRAQGLKVWDHATLACLARVFELRSDAAGARRFATAAARARWLAGAHLTHDALMRLHGHLREGNAAALAGDTARAEGEFNSALALHDGDQTACNGLANLRIVEQRYGEAEELLRQGTLWGDRTYPTLLLKRGGLLEQLGRRNEARALYQHLARLVPRFQPVRDRLLALNAIEAAAA